MKMIRRGHYSSNNFQDSNKTKSTKIKILGYLLRVLFFNVFELGAESANQVISNEALRSPDALCLPLLPLLLTYSAFSHIYNGAQELY
jgi:hypothetical protein